MPRKARVGSDAWSGLAGARGLTSSDVNPANWEHVDERSMTPDREETFRKRKNAIEAYMRGVSTAALKESWGFSRSHVTALINRCLTQHPDGKLWGWRGVVPHIRVTEWTRRTPPPTGPDDQSGRAGVLQWLFASPGHQKSALEKRFRKKILERPSGLKGKRTPKQKLFKWFLDELREAGCERRMEWPFDTEFLGRTTIYRFITRVRNEDPGRARELEGGTNAIRKAKAGDGTNRPHFPVFRRVECDAHKLDLRMVVMVPSPQGGYEPRKVNRLWVIVLIETESRAVLGYYLSMRKDPAADDVLRAIRNALSQWERRPISFSRAPYVEGAALPSAWNPKYLGACWDEFSVDGALANICDRVKDPLDQVVGAKILAPNVPGSFSVRRSLDDRPFIESFFKAIAERGVHGLSPSTKSKHPDLKGDADPVVVANAVQLQIEYIQELLDIIIANYNATPHTGIGSRSPLSQLDFLCAANGNHFRIADPREVARLGATRKLCTLLGGVHTGRRPHFNCANARYSSEMLVQRPDLIGQSFWLTIENENDARWATVTDKNGMFICAVRAAPPWHRTPHSLYVRQAIRALESKRLLFLNGNVDAVEELIKYCENTHNKKLPVHTAYLEARQIIRNHADSLSSEPMLTSLDIGSHSENNFLMPAEDKHPARPEQIKELAAARSTPTQSTKSNNIPIAPKTGRPLPPMRKARTW